MSNTSVVPEKPAAEPSPGIPEASPKSAKKFQVIRAVHPPEGNAETGTSPETGARPWPAGITQIYLFGLYVVASLLIPTGIGFWFDVRAAHAFPLLGLVGLALGTVITVYGVYRMVWPHIRNTGASYRGK